MNGGLKCWSDSWVQRGEKRRKGLFSDKLPVRDFVPPFHSWAIQKHRVWGTTTLRGETESCCSSARASYAPVLKVSQADGKRHRNTKGDLRIYKGCGTSDLTHSITREAPLMCCSSFHSNFLPPLVPESCSMQKTDKVENHVRTAYLCMTTPITKIDYGEHRLILVIIIILITVNVVSCYCAIIP